MSEHMDKERIAANPDYYSTPISVEDYDKLRFPIRQEMRLHIKWLRDRLKEATQCEFCGGPLSKGLCNIHDNDE